MPDKRQWKPSSPVFEPEDVLICVNIPKIEEYIINLSEMEYKSFITPILTLKGMRYCIDQFESVMSDEPKSTKQSEIDNEEWEVVEEDKAWE